MQNWIYVLIVRKLNICFEFIQADQLNRTQIVLCCHGIDYKLFQFMVLWMPSGRPIESTTCLSLLPWNQLGVVIIPDFTNSFQTNQSNQPHVFICCHGISLMLLWFMILWMLSTLLLRFTKNPRENHTSLGLTLRLYMFLKKKTIQ
jgi:hypothetical protein